MHHMCHVESLHMLRASFPILGCHVKMLLIYRSVASLLRALNLSLSSILGHCFSCQSCTCADTAAQLYLQGLYLI